MKSLLRVFILALLVFAGLSAFSVPSTKVLAGIPGPQPREPLPCMPPQAGAAVGACTR